MAVSTRIAVIAVGDRLRHDDGIGWEALCRLRERAAARPLPPGTVLAECDQDPGWVIRLWDDTELAIVLEPAHGRPGHPGRVYRLELDSAALRRPDCLGPHGLGEAVEPARELDRLPRRLVSYAVEAADTTLGRGLSAPVAGAVDVLAERVEEEIVRHRGAAARDTGGDGRT
ncbi:hydrogenase maturation protease [Streptomyces caeni]|uniref:Hydrogenase maturation protease n=1 Tax=Streptomyces caeni TaxID=2307231 RepID=A0ABW4IRH9_9ACTN